VPNPCILITAVRIFDYKENQFIFKRSLVGVRVLGGLRMCAFILRKFIVLLLLLLLLIIIITITITTIIITTTITVITWAG
jgi:hypothetical protein